MNDAVLHYSKKETVEMIAMTDEKRKRGRPVGSQTRQNMVDILSVLKSATGYDLYKVYIKVFSKITLRTVYYNLHKGTLLDIFKVNVVKTEQGNYSWGPQAEKKYYELGPKAKPSKDKELLEAISRAAS